MTVTIETIALFSTIALGLIWLIHRSLLPKPIPGIPYDRASAARLLGDVPDLLKYQAETQETLSFLRKRCEDLRSPIVQVFLRPFGGKPWVVLADLQETQDILARRGREFDRSQMFSDLFVSLYPNTQIVMKTTDQWRWNRRLVAESMAPNFLNNVATHMVYEKTQDMIDLWREKLRLCQGRPINIMEDVLACAADTIFAATFGMGLGATKSQTEFLAEKKSIVLPDDEEAIVEVPAGPHPPLWQAISTVVRSSAVVLKSPLGRTAHWFNVNFSPSLRHAIRVRDEVVMARIKESWRKFGESEMRDNEIETKGKTASASTSNMESIIDLLVPKEAALAKKEGRAPDHASKYLLDELHGFLVAGFDTTGGTMNWGFKYLTAYQEVQTKIRQELRETFPEILAAREQPSAEKVAKAGLPYLDALIQEVLRHSAIVPVIVRETMQDSVVLGHVIPKGVDLCMLTFGPSLTTPAMSVDDNTRSTSSSEFKADADKWQQSTDMGDFKPERWLKRDEETGNIEFDFRAGPMITFGAGARSCFGKKLAQLEMRVIYSLVLWNFDLRPIPAALSGWEATDVLAHNARAVPICLAEAM